MSVSKELKEKLDYYEQIYYALDEPVPFKQGLKCYPVLVKDYYKFYNYYGCITMDKNIKIVNDEYGRPQKVSNPKGIGQNYLEYLIDQMHDKDKGAIITSQVMGLFELVFRIPKGMYCPECGHTVTYEEIFGDMENYIQKQKDQVQQLYEAALIEQESLSGEKITNRSVPADIMEKVVYNARNEYFIQASVCPKCNNKLRDVFSIKEKNNIRTFMIKDIEINSQDFDEFKALVPRQNILDFDGDMYVDPELKEELELKAKLQNKDYTSPTLEKQLVCVGIATGYTLDYLHSITMRKLSMMLRLVDRERTYYAQLQASMSGMVTFKEDPKHWIFSDDKKNIKDELTSLDSFEKKFSSVT